MSYDESVERVLRKIAHHNGNVFGCIAAYDDAIYSSLPEIYDLIDVDAVVEYATHMFAVSDVLDTGEDTFQEVFIAFQGHSFIVRKMRTGMLILATKPVKRVSFRKMQLGLNLFLKPLERALKTAAGEGQPVQVQESHRGARGLRRVFGSLV